MQDYTILKTASYRRGQANRRVFRFIPFSNDGLSHDPAIHSSEGSYGPSCGKPLMTPPAVRKTTTEPGGIGNALALILFVAIISLNILVFGHLLPGVTAGSESTKGYRNWVLSALGRAPDVSRSVPTQYMGAGSVRGVK